MGAMLSVSDTTYIDGPGDIAFAALENPDTQLLSDGKTAISIVALAPGPIRQGARFRAAFRRMGAVPCECTAFERDSLLEFSATTPFGVASYRFVIRGSGDGTRVAQTISLVPNLLGEVLWPIAIRRIAEDHVRSLNDRLKTYVQAVAPGRRR
jgi:hypothetical protein